jgi:hypothetical protein
MFPEHFNQYCIVKGYFYESDRWCKSLQHRIMKFSEYVFHYHGYEVILVADTKEELEEYIETLSQ